MDSETIKAVGAVIGVVGGLITLGERIMSFRTKYQDKLRGRQKTPTETGQSRRAPFLSVNFLPRQEICVIVGTGALINFVALALSTRLTSILYLDMTGTAIAALLLGPWYGALTGLLSNGLINWVLYPGHDGDYVVFPWALVNIIGGLLWGFFGRSSSFTRFMASGNAGLGRQIIYLIQFGVLGAALMAVPGTGVELALGKQGILAFDPEIAGALDKLLIGSVNDVSAFFSQYFSERTSAGIARWLVAWAQNTARYIPDKTLSFAIAIVAIKAGFPLFERQLIHARVNANTSKPGWLDPVILIAGLLPYTATLLSSSHYGPHSYWPLWTAPIGIAMVGMLFESVRSDVPGSKAMKSQERKEVYTKAASLLPRGAAIRPGPNFALACLAASLLFVLVLPLLVPNYLRIAFNFLCLVYGFQLTLHLYCIALGQNLYARDDRPPRKSAALT